MASYATQTQFEGFVEGWVTDDVAALARLLERATYDIDSVFGPVPIITTGVYAGHKADPTTWAQWEADTLARATCAQALHRFNHRNPGTGEIQERRKRIKGPDFEEEYGDGATSGTGRIAADVAPELVKLNHRRRLAARARA